MKLHQVCNPTKNRNAIKNQSNGILRGGKWRLFEGYPLIECMHALKFEIFGNDMSEVFCLGDDFDAVLFLFVYHQRLTEIFFVIVFFLQIHRGILTLAYFVFDTFAGRHLDCNLISYNDISYTYTGFINMHTMVSRVFLCQTLRSRASKLRRL